jgi:3-hydroxybutyryl-CoA dehydrogenase/3-hydroxyacyl-CoA dehydrogenase
VAELRVGVVGAGVMGSGIAQVTATAGFPTVCFDPDPAAIERAHEHVTTGRYGLDRAVERGKLTRADADAARERLEFTSSLEAAAAGHVVIEAVPEHLDLKVRVFRDLDRVAPPDSVLASNTSGFSIAALAAATDRPDRVIGWHWASPAPVMRFAEVVRTRATSDATVERIRTVAAACGKNPIVVNDVDTKWGFVANRVYGATLDEARRVVEEGVATPDDVDQLMVDCFGWPTGPYTMIRGARQGWT